MSKVRADDYLARDGVGAPDFSGGINATGVITATSFSGSSTGLTGTPSITVQDVTAEYVSIAGTLTYDDVVNVDSVGIVTAGKGLRATAGGLNVVAGVSTFGGAIDPNSTLDVDGDTQLDDLTVAGVATFSAGIDANSTLDVDGDTQLDDLNVAGVATFTSAAKFSPTTGTGTTIGLGGVNVSGIVTATSFDGGGNVPAGQTGSVTLAASDTGRFVSASGGITVPASIFATGDVISIYNNTGGNITITCSAPSAVYLGTDGSTKTSLTLTTRCICTIICVDSSSSGTFVATGGGLA